MSREFFPTAGPEDNTPQAFPGPALRVIRTIVISALFLTLFARGISAEIAVLPYRVDTPSSRMPLSAGPEYSRLLSLALLIGKDIEVLSPRDIELDLRRLNLDTQKTLTESDLNALGRSRYVDQIVLGKLSRVGGKYRSESIIYSLKNGRIITKNRREAQSLFGLAEREARDLFPQVKNRLDEKSLNPKVDIAFLFDASFGVSRDWDSVKSGISRFAERISDGWDLETRVHLLPFSSQHTARQGEFNITTPSRLASKLIAFRVRGENSQRNLSDGLSFAVKNISWRSGAEKIIVLISGSGLSQKQFTEGAVLQAKKKGIRVHCLCIGSLDWNGTSVYRYLSNIGKGSFVFATYRQKLYDRDGRTINLFYEGGRLFYSRRDTVPWKEGLLSGKTGRDLADIREQIEEIQVVGKKTRPTPFNMARYFPSLTGIVTVKADPVEDNIRQALSAVTRSTSSRRFSSSKKIVARVLLNDGTMSLWIRISGRRELDFFRKKSGSNYLFPIGISLQKSPSDPHGVTINPHRVITHVPADFIPDMLYGNFSDMVKDPDRYTGTGLLRPPVWFVKVRAVQIDEKDTRDIRD